MSDSNWRSGYSNTGGRPRSDPILTGCTHFELTDPYRLPAAAPVAGRLIEVPSHGRVAMAAAIAVQFVAHDLISNALDQRLLAAWTIRRLLLRRLNVADIRVIQPAANGNFISGQQRFGRCPVAILQTKIGMKGRKVHRHVRSQRFEHPVAHRLELVMRIVLARDDEIGDLGPHV